MAYKNIISIVAIVLLAFFSFLMLRIMFIYIPIKNDVGFLQLKQGYIDITEWRIAFFIHVFTSILALLAGFSQFNKSILTLFQNSAKNFQSRFLIISLNNLLSFFIICFADSTSPPTPATTDL